LLLNDLIEPIKSKHVSKRPEEYKRAKIRGVVLARARIPISALNFVKSTDLKG
jgi:hypothetical protein